MQVCKKKFVNYLFKMVQCSTAFYLTAFIFLFIAFAGCKKNVKIVDEGCAAPQDSLFHSHPAVIAHPEKPNIILVIGDDVGYEIPGFFGGQSYSTPNLDFMAANGMTFTHFYSHPDGFPSRMAIYTGKYNYRNYEHWGLIPPSEKTIGNMLEDGGYATCFAGKWQGSGGGEAINNFGFQKYLVYLPYPADQRVGRYKTPQLYADGAYLPQEQVQCAYSEDLFVKYLSDFIDTNINKPFFAIYACNLIGGPYVPTPDDQGYAKWTERDDTKSDNPDEYNAGMVSYMDKKIGQLIKKIKTSDLENNTLIMFCGDNATWSGITSLWKGQTVTGSKTLTNWRGLTNPVVAYWPGKIAPGSVTNNLIDYTDFFTTFASVANISSLENYGTLDGVSFYHNLVNQPGTNKDVIKCYWNNDPEDDSIVPPEVFVFDNDYKLFDDSTHKAGPAYRYKRFYDLKADMEEKNPIPDSLLTPEQKAKKDAFIGILKTMYQ
jgi:arylsulfatase A